VKPADDGDSLEKCRENVVNANHEEGGYRTSVSGVVCLAVNEAARLMQDRKQWRKYVYLSLILHQRMALDLI